MWKWPSLVGTFSVIDSNFAKVRLRLHAPRRDQEMYELFRHIKLSANCCNHTPPASIEVCRGETRSWSCYLWWFVRRLVYLGVEYSSPPASNLLNLCSPTIGEIVAGSREVWKPNICRKCRAVLLPWFDLCGWELRLWPRLVWELSSALQGDCNCRA